MKKTIEEVKDIIDEEGLAYAVEEYMSHRSIEDETLARLWKEAEEALHKIKYYLDEE